MNGIAKATLHIPTRSPVLHSAQQKRTTKQKIDRLRQRKKIFSGVAVLKSTPKSTPATKKKPAEPLAVRVSVFLALVGGTGIEPVTPAV